METMLETPPVNEVPAATGPTVEYEVAEVCDILDKDSRNQIEQLLLTSLQAISDHMANVVLDDDSDEADGDGTQSEGALNGDGSIDDDATEEEVSRMMVPEVAESLEPLRARMAEQFNAVAWDTEREILLKDEYIIRAARRYGIEPESRFTMPIPDNPCILDFILPRVEFGEWRTQHCARINTNFFSKGKYEYVHAPAEDWVTYRYYCQCWGEPRERNDRKKGGVSGKTRVRGKSMKSGCTARITLIPTTCTEVRSGMVEPAWIVSYRYRHNHILDGITDIGSRQKSAAIKATIRSLILEGSTVQRVMQQLTMDYDKFTRILSGNGQQLSRDYFVTYDDVYNIWYVFMNKAMRKDSDPVLSCIKWMEEFEGTTLSPTATKTITSVAYTLDSPPNGN
ncbi:hypothetical protein EC968_005916 [Mortierella alpina]|nr:hypothetical protein EC968_005916 [Mortierella alpina]